MIEPNNATYCRNRLISDTSVTLATLNEYVVKL